MNNDGFAEMVRKRSGVSSTKEIARKAVEDDWKRSKKRKRKGGGGGGSSSESDYEDDRQRSKRDKMSRKLDRDDDEEDDDDDDDDELSTEYRDRAKERREGKLDKEEENATKDNNTTSSLFPTRGLDLSLARKIRKEMKDTNNLEQTENNDKVSGDFKSLPSMEDAFSTLKDFANDGNDDSSTAAIVIYVRKILGQTMKSRPTNNVKCSLAGRNIQQSRLALAIDGTGCPINLKRTWERPRELKHSSTMNSTEPLDTEVIEKINKAFRKNKFDMQETSGTANKETNDGKRRKQEQQRATNNNTKAKTEETSAKDESDEDDDIFGGLDDYVPQESKVES